MSRRALPLLVFVLLAGALTAAYLLQEPTEHPLAGGPLVQLAPHLRRLPDGPDGEITARSLVEATLDELEGSPRGPVLEALRHPDGGARWAGLLAVPRYGPPDEALAEALTPLLSAEEVRVRRLAANACGFLGAEYAAVEPALEAAARDAEAGVRAEALATLARRTARADGLWTLFADALADAHAPARAAAAKGLARIELGERLPPRVLGGLRKRLVKAMGDEVADVRMYAVMALGRAGAAAAPDVPAMLALLDDESTLVRGTAANALGEVGVAALPALREALVDPSPQRASSLLWALRLIGEPAVPLLEEATAHAMPALRVQAAMKLWELQQPVATTVAVLERALEGEDPDARRLAARGFARLGTAGASARGTLARHRDDEDAVVRAAVRSALARIEAAGDDGDR